MNTFFPHIQLKSSLILALRLVSLFLVFGYYNNLFGQNALQGFHYQTVLRNADNQPIVGQILHIKIYIQGDQESQQIYYEEVHEVKTDHQGLINLHIGTGFEKKGFLSNIPWASSPLWLKLELAKKIEKTPTVISLNQIYAVPFAFHADRTGRIEDSELELLEKNQSIYWTTSGNSGTKSEVHFLGTEDTTDLYFKIGNTAKMVSRANGQTLIIAKQSGNQNVREDYPLTIEGSNQGVYIQVNGSRSNATNFITFEDTKGFQGAIEGQTLDELRDDWEYKFELNVYDLQIASISLQLAAGIVEAPALLSTGFASAGGAATLIIVAEASARLAATIINRKKYKKEIEGEVGVTYSSGSADYAEWLPRQEAETNMSFGEIVGIKGGKISLNTTGASHIRVISKNPGVLGNTPPDGQEKDYEKVAFMGQVPVKVVGKVNVGDFIIPSGNHDGYGIAVAPNQMKAGDYARILGVAWEASKDPYFNYINVAIGINSNQLSKKIEQLEQKANAVRAYLNGQQSSLVLSVDSLLQTQQTTFYKKFSDEEYDAIIEQKQLEIKQMINQVKENLLANGTTFDEEPQLKSLFDDPIAYLKQLRRDPRFVSYWAAVDRRRLSQNR